MITHHLIELYESYHTPYILISLIAFNLFLLHFHDFHHCYTTYCDKIMIYRWSNNQNTVTLIIGQMLDISKPWNLCNIKYVIDSDICASILSIIFEFINRSSLKKAVTSVTEYRGTIKLLKPICVSVVVMFTTQYRLTNVFCIW